MPTKRCVQVEEIIHDGKHGACCGDKTKCHRKRLLGKFGQSCYQVRDKE